MERQTGVISVSDTAALSPCLCATATQGEAIPVDARTGVESRTQEVFRRVRSGSAWVVGSRLAGIAVTLLMNVELARRLTPEDFGKISLVLSLIAFASGLAVFGASGAVLRFVPESVGLNQSRRAKDALAHLLAICGIGCVITGFLTWAAWGSIAACFQLPTSAELAVIVAISLGLLAVLQLAAESLRSLHELRIASLLSGGQTGGLLSNLLFLGAIALTAGTMLSLESALTLNLLTMLVAAALGIGLLWFVSRRRFAAASIEPLSPGESARLGALLAVCLPLMLIQVITFCSTQADLWIAGAFCGQDLALYSAARRLVLVVVMPLQMANYLVMGSIAELHAQGRARDLEHLLRRTATLFAAPSLAAFLFILCFGGLLLKALFGEFYGQAATMLTVVSFGQLLLALAGSCHCALLMTGQETKALAVNFSAALALGAAGPLAAMRFGGLGLAVTYAAIVSLESVFLAVLARRQLGVWTCVDPRLLRPILQSWLRGNDADAGGGELEIGAKAEGDDHRLEHTHAD